MTDPDLILLDEPAAGVNRTLLQHLLDHIHRLERQGKTIVIVEHDMNVIMNHCERIFVMDGGVKIAEDRPPRSSVTSAFSRPTSAAGADMTSTVKGPRRRPDRACAVRCVPHGGGSSHRKR